MLSNGKYVNILLYGIVNPPASSYSIDLAILGFDGNVIQYANQLLQLTTTTRPPNLYLSYFDLSNYDCASFSVMKLCFDAAPYQTAGSLSGELWLQLPE